MSITLVANEVYRGPRPEPADFGPIVARFATVISLEGQEEDDKEWRREKERRDEEMTMGRSHDPRP
jgi:hypothetical protein